MLFYRYYDGVPNSRRVCVVFFQTSHYRFLQVFQFGSFIRVVTRRRASPRPSSVQLVQLRPTVGLPSGCVAVFFRRVRHRRVANHPIVGVQGGALRFFRAFVVVSSLLSRRTVRVVFLVVLVEGGLRRRFKSFYFSGFFYGFPRCQYPSASSLFFLRDQGRPYVGVPVSYVLRFGRSFPGVPSRLFLVRLSSPPFVPGVTVERLADEDVKWGDFNVV